MLSNNDGSGKRLGKFELSGVNFIGVGSNRSRRMFVIDTYTSADYDLECTAKNAKIS